MTAASELPTLGVVLHEKKDGTERLIAAFADEVRAQGFSVGGLIQETRVLPNGKTRMELVDIKTANRYLISQDLGSGSQACGLDPTGLTDASAVLRRDIATGPDLLVINKFAIAERDGQGLLQEMFDAIQRGLTILTSVSTVYLDDWIKASGGMGTLIDPNPDALRRWWASAKQG